MSSLSKHREMDLMMLVMSDYKVETVNAGIQEFFVEFKGPTKRRVFAGPAKKKDLKELLAEKTDCRSKPSV